MHQLNRNFGQFPGPLEPGLESMNARPAISVDVRRLQPLEIVLMRRYVHEMPLDGFEAFDELAEDLERQLAMLPRTDLPFALTVYGAFAASPYPIDRLHLGLIVRSLTQADHDTGYAFLRQLVRDKIPGVRRDCYETIDHHLRRTDITAEEGLAQEGLTLADGHQLRDDHHRAESHGDFYIVDENDVTEPLREATDSLVSITRV
jgi:hypothetical protein